MESIKISTHTLLTLLFSKVFIYYIMVLWLKKFGETIYCFFCLQDILRAHWSTDDFYKFFSEDTWY